MEQDCAGPPRGTSAGLGPRYGNPSSLVRYGQGAARTWAPSALGSTPFLDPGAAQPQRAVSALCAPPIALRAHPDRWAAPVGPGAAGTFITPEAQRVRGAPHPTPPPPPQVHQGFVGSFETAAGEAFALPGG